MKKRFENAHVGDRVYCPMFRAGTIESRNERTLLIEFDLYRGLAPFDLDGNPLNGPGLLYLNDQGEPIETRPIKWNEVKPGTMCFAWDDGQQNPPHRVKFRFVADGVPWFEMTETVLRAFKHAEVIDNGQI